MELVKDTNLQFVSKRKKFFFASGIIILIGIISMLFQGLNYGIDFAGGTLLQLDFENNVSVAEVRDVLGEMSLASSTIQSLSGNEIMIRTGQISLEEREKMLETIESKIEPFEVLKVEMVGPVIGESLKKLALLAIIFAFIGIIVYITIRFEFKFALSSIIALAHDVLITIGILSIMQKEITIPIVAAILTVVGYSINNTIVIFDRLRENLKFKGHTIFGELIDLSINQTLTRTINTALTTLLPIMVLYFLGGSLSDFAFVLFIGLLVGTYSSIFIAGPLILELKKGVKFQPQHVMQANKKEKKAADLKKNDQKKK
ncbi:MAG: protein translocase subunit SecF [Candidatus Atribacteria bacterium]|nr:protein translocase subunit SecF [Candidatus Atribacteria bacterium]